MDTAAMRARCPRSVPLGAARLARHAFFIMDNGYASIRPDPESVVHGLAWQLALSDVAALDRYEDIAGGLYTKRMLPVRLPGRFCTALTYVGRSTRPGTPTRDYLDTILEAANRLQFPAAYIQHLKRWLLRGGQRAGPHARFVPSLQVD